MTLARFRRAARRGVARVLFCGESGFAATPNVQRAWAPRRTPHATTPVSHAKRVSVIGALDVQSHELIFDTATTTNTRDKVIAFLDRLALGNDGRPLVIILDNAAIHHHIDPAIKYHWLAEHHMILWHSPPYSPELNPIEIVWKQAKYFWRRFTTWTKETLEQEVRSLIAGYGPKFQINFA